MDREKSISAPRVHQKPPAERAVGSVSVGGDGEVTEVEFRGLGDGDAQGGAGGLVGPVSGELSDVRGDKNVIRAVPVVIGAVEHQVLDRRAVGVDPDAVQHGLIHLKLLLCYF